MAPTLRRIVVASKKVFKVTLVLFVGYLLVLTCAVLWAFEVKLKRWPTFIYGAPLMVRVGDDIRRIRLLERLSRLGYVRSPTMVAGPGQWSRSGSGLDVDLKYCPIQGRGIVSGPVTFSLDLDRIRSIHLARSLQDVDSVVLEPELIGVLPSEGSTPSLCRPVPLDRVPSLLVDAVVFTEDRRFQSHHGIDLGSMVRALKANVKAWRYVQGASTITQQLIRMTLLTPQKTLFRKGNEVLLALIADALYGKRTILQAYLNRVYLGHWGQYPINGVAEASRQLFGKELQQLEVEECAFIAATIMAPNIITPRRHPERARGRRNVILGLLLKEGKITREQYDKALATPVRIRKQAMPHVKAAAFVELVKEAVQRETGLGSGKQHDVITSLDPLLQKESNLEIRNLGRRGTETHLVILVPKTGEITAYVAPGPDKWDGTGGSLESVLPMAMVASLIPESDKHARFTLTSRLFPQEAGGRPVTVREAFAADKSHLAGRLIDSIGRTSIVQMLGEFNVQATPKGTDAIAIEPLRPLEMARSFTLLATWGTNPPEFRVLKTLPEVQARSEAGEKHIGVSPGALFLVNYLMKDVRPLGEVHRGTGEAVLTPSVFIARDDSGLWGVAYRRDVLLLVRIPGRGLGSGRVERMMLRLLPHPRPSDRQVPLAPKGVVFRTICLDSGLRATSICRRVIPEAFIRGTQPAEWCPLRHGAESVQSTGGTKSGKR